MEQRESGKIGLYPLIIHNIIVISYIIINLLIKMRTIPGETGNGTPSPYCCKVQLLLDITQNSLYMYTKISMVTR